MESPYIIQLLPNTSCLRRKFIFTGQANHLCIQKVPLEGIEIKNLYILPCFVSVLRTFKLQGALSNSHLLPEMQVALPAKLAKNCTQFLSIDSDEIGVKLKVPLEGIELSSTP